MRKKIRLHLPPEAYVKSFEEVMGYYQNKTYRENKESPLQWNMLTQNKCPQCLKVFYGSTRIDKVEVKKDEITVIEKKMTHICGFSIKESKMREIVANLTSGNIDESHSEEDGLYE